MLFTDPPNGDYPPGADGDGMPEHALAFKDTLSMVSEGTMAKIAVHLLAGVKPIVNPNVIVNYASPPLHATQGMVVWICH